MRRLRGACRSVRRRGRCRGATRPWLGSRSRGSHPRCRRSPPCRRARNPPSYAVDALSESKRKGFFCFFDEAAVALLAS